MAELRKDSSGHFLTEFEVKLIDGTATLDDYRRELGRRIGQHMDNGYGPNPILPTPDGAPSFGEYHSQREVGRLEELTDAGNFGLATLCIQEAQSAIQTAKICYYKETALECAARAKTLLRLAQEADSNVLDTVPELASKISSFVFVEPFQDD